MKIPEQLLELSKLVIGSKCTKTLLIENDFSHSKCLKLLLSKVLGMGIIFGSMIVKLPQILKIVDSKSAKGLSFVSVLLETIAIYIALVYNLRANNPFSTFGETLFMSIQNIVILGLILVLNRRFVSGFLFMVTLFAAGAVCFVPEIVDNHKLAVMQGMGIPLIILSRVPQIYVNMKNSSTGQLSAISVLLIWLGSIARVFTTVQEVKDKLILGGFVLTAVLNSILAFQMGFYWKKAVKKIKTQ